ncbi:YciI family protein [Kitasatospora sp. NPDC051914]|uniref:YciI family protein n=1 Tax=Kitasatospora sp. NPDC051914 TaxID=3154945 RepID=UPI00342FFC38
MFVVTVNYTASPAEVDPHRAAHGEWLSGLLAEGLLLAAGRRPSLTGGVYLVPAMPAEALDRLLAADPYLSHGVAAHTVVEFTPMLVAPGLEGLKAS